MWLDRGAMREVLFPLGARLSTWVALAAFVAVALQLRDRRAWLAAAAWLFGFEQAWELTGYLRAIPQHGLVPVFSHLIVGTVIVLICARFGARPWMPLLAATAVVWAIWLATGFHSNYHNMTNFEVVPEVLNETAKTLWALAYLVPLWMARRTDRSGRTTVTQSYY